MRNRSRVQGSKVQRSGILESRTISNKKFPTNMPSLRDI
jgi:hypothetical protein